MEIRLLAKFALQAILRTNQELRVGTIAILAVAFRLARVTAQTAYVREATFGTSLHQLEIVRA